MGVNRNHSYLIEIIDGVTILAFPLPCTCRMAIGRPAAAIEASKTTFKQGHCRNNSFVDSGSQEDLCGSEIGAIFGRKIFFQSTLYIPNIRKEVTVCEMCWRCVKRL